MKSNKGLLIDQKQRLTFASDLQDSHISSSIVTDNVSTEMKEDISQATKLLNDIERTISRCNVLSRKKMASNSLSDRRAHARSQKRYQLATIVMSVVIVLIGLVGLYSHAKIHDRLTAIEPTASVNYRISNEHANLPLNIKSDKMP